MGEFFTRNSPININIMRVIIILTLTMICSTFVYAQKEYKKNHIQIGRSGYYFGDQPFRIGKVSLGKTNHGIFPVLPFISYERSMSSQFSLRLSVEEFLTSYYCSKKKCDHSPPLNKVFLREFFDIQLDAKKSFLYSDKFRLSGFATSSFVIFGSEHRVIKYIDRGFWREGMSEGISINGIGLGLGTDVSYDILKGITINLKTGYLYYFSPLKSSLYAGLSMGYEF